MTNIIFDIFAQRQFEFADLNKYLWLVFIIPLLALVYLYGFYKKKQALGKFASLNVLQYIASSVSRNRQIAKAIILLFAVLLIIIALMRPRGNPTEEQLQREGRDVCFVLDVSNSMLAQDLKPNRLERAKLSINDVIDIISRDRVSLVIFAGSVALKCPLTSDYHFFRNILNKVSPKDVAQGGTNLGDAIRQAVEKIFMGNDAKYKDLILISDGEDLEESFPVEAAQFAAQQGIRIHAVGIGDPQGTPVPDPDNPSRYLKYEGETVISRLDEKTLQKIAAATPGGTYIPVRTGNMDLGELYRKVIAVAEKQKYQSEVKIRWTEWYQVPLLAAIILLILESFISDRKTFKSRKIVSFISAVFFYLLLINTPAYGNQTAVKLVTDGNVLYRQGKYPEALEKYKQAEELMPESPEVQFNMANTHYQQGEHDIAVDLYKKVLTNPNSKDEITNKAIYNLGNCAFRQAEKLADSDLNESLNKYKESIEYYRDTIERAKDKTDKTLPEVEDAKHNIEVARLRIKDLLDKIKKQQEEQQKQQEQQQNLQDKLKEAIEKQKQIEENTSKTQEEKKNNPQNDMSRQSQEIKQEQDENIKQTEEISNQMQKMQDEMAKSEESKSEQQQKLERAKQEIDKSIEEQKDSSENLDKTDLDKAKEKQTKARELLEKALEELQSENKEQAQNNSQKQEENQGKQNEESKKGESKEQKEKEQKQKNADDQKQEKMTPQEAKQKMEEMKARFQRARKMREEELKRKGFEIIQDTERQPVKKNW